MRLRFLVSDIASAVIILFKLLIYLDAVLKSSHGCVVRAVNFRLADFSSSPVVACMSRW